MKLVHVAVGVIVQNGAVFLTKRLESAHQGGKWEFPGGKVETGETVAQALHRELKEEVFIDVLSAEELTIIEHDYGDKKVCLDVRLVEEFEGKASHQEGQQSQWVTITNLHQFTFPEANRVIIDKLVNSYAKS